MQFAKPALLSPEKAAPDVHRGSLVPCAGWLRREQTTQDDLRGRETNITGEGDDIY